METLREIEDQKARLAALDASIARGLADAEAGRVKSAAEVFDKVESRLKEKAHSAD